MEKMRSYVKKDVYFIEKGKEYEIYCIGVFLKNSQRITNRLY